MTCETWLRPNRRALLFGMVPPALAGVLGIAIVSGALGHTGSGWQLRAGWAIVAVAGGTVGLLAAQARRPRIGFADGELWLFLRAVRPIHVPVEAVECFLLGSGSVSLPGSDPHDTRAHNLVMRISPKSAELAQGDVHRALGSWSDSHVTIRGLWCEPLSIAVVERLNQRLAAAQRAVSKQENRA